VAASVVPGCDHGTVTTTDPAAPPGDTDPAPAPAPARLTLVQVPFDDPRAVRLRDDMDVEMTARYRDPGVVEPAELVAARDAALHLSADVVLATLLVLDDEGTPVGHAALRRRGEDGEVKRVVVVDGRRGSGIGRRIMAEVERLAREAGLRRLVLQTGSRQPDAVALYEKLGWTPIPLFEPYASTMPTSLTYEKVLDRG